tara:strand:- start:863 stop:1216 length:354 start_codon:yes stop_codon:yes gene_type:complete
MILSLEKPQDVEINVQRGADLSLVLTFETALTGSEMIFTVRKLTDSSSPVLITETVTSFTTVTIANDTCTFTKSALAMSAITQGDYYYSIQEKPSGAQLRTRLKGRFVVEAHAGVNL